MFYDFLLLGDFLLIFCPGSGSQAVLSVIGHRVRGWTEGGELLPPLALTVPLLPSSLFLQGWKHYRNLTTWNIPQQLMRLVM